MIFKDVNSDEFNKEVSRGKDAQSFQNWALESAKIEIRETSHDNREEAANEPARGPERTVPHNANF